MRWTWLFGVGLAFASPAYADWTTHNVLDHLRGVIGEGAGVAGTVEEESGRRSRQAVLNVHCVNNSTTVFAEIGFVTTGGYVAVSYSLDGGPVRRQTWNICKSDDCIVLLQGAGAAFARDLMKARELKMVIHRPHLSDLMATFEIADGRDALALVGKACHWLPK